MLGINVYSGSFLYYESQYSVFISMALWLEQWIHHEGVVTVVCSIPARVDFDDFGSSALKAQAPHQVGVTAV